MKVIIFGLICLFAIGRADPTNVDTDAIVKNALSGINFELLPKQLVNRLMFLIATDILSEDQVQVMIDRYADEILTNLQNFIRNNNLNIVNLPDEHLSLKPTGTIDLKNGILEDLDTIWRREDVTLTYDRAYRKLVLEIPIKFDDLKFSYDYHTKALFISISGGVHGSVTDIKVNADLSFDFNTMTAFLDHYDMKDSGKVTVKFTGNKIIDWLTNAMTSVIDHLLGQVIVNVLAKLIRENLRDLMEKVNEVIDGIIHP